MNFFSSLKTHFPLFLWSSSLVFWWSLRDEFVLWQCSLQLPLRCQCSGESFSFSSVLYNGIIPFVIPIIIYVLVIPPNLCLKLMSLSWIPDFCCQVKSVSSMHGYYLMNYHFLFVYLLLSFGMCASSLHSKPLPTHQPFHCSVRIGLKKSKSDHIMVLPSTGILITSQNSS